MNINSIKFNYWIEPEFIAHFLASRFGEKGLSWLDSNGRENAEYSFLGVNPKTIISSKNHNYDNPFEKLEQIDQGFWIGWLSYEAGSWIEPNNSWRESEISTLWIASYDPIIKFNILKKEITIEGTNFNEIEEYKKLIDEMNIQKIKDSMTNSLIFDFSNLNLDKKGEKFKENVLKIKELISQGDIFQANLTTQVEIESSEEYKYLDIYSKIRSKLKAPFGGVIIGLSLIHI